MILIFIVRLNFLVAVCIKSKRERGTPRVSTPLRILKSKLQKKNDSLVFSTILTAFELWVFLTQEKKQKKDAGKFTIIFVARLLTF